MPEGLLASHIEWWGEATNDALSSVVKELGISPELEEMIKKLDDEDRAMCTRSLQKIVKDVKEKNIWNVNRDKKIKETLASEYWIIYKQEVNNWTILETTSSTEIINSREQVDTRMRDLTERLDALKSLDSKIVDEEIKTEKASQPLPEDIRWNISKATWIPPGDLESVIQSRTNPLVNNLVDTYYLTRPETEKRIKSRLPDGIQWDAERKFSDLRASAREYGVLAPFRADELESRISDKPTRSQELIMSGAKSITGGRGDLPIVREWEKLYFKSADGKEVTHRMDISKIPPIITKIRWSLELSYPVPNPKEAQERSLLVEQYDKNRKESGAITEEVQSAHLATLPKLRLFKQNALSIDEFSTAIEGISPWNTREKRKEMVDVLIALCQRAQSSNAFQARTELNGEELTTIEGFDDYFYGQRLRAVDLKKKLEEETVIDAKIKWFKWGSEKSINESISAGNLDGLDRLGITRLSSMEEITALLMTQNGAEMWNRWWNPEDIETSLLTESISPSMWEKILMALRSIYSNITGVKNEFISISDTLKSLNAVENNGKSRLANALAKYRVTTKWWGNLRKEDFQKLI
jgi:mRNA-degrading endonuclease RelE of RelBE toxin-antitoxin system